MLIPSGHPPRTSWILAACATAILATTASATPADSLAAPPPSVRRWQTQALRPDRLNHASLALAIGVGSGVAVRSPASGAGIALGLGVGKELVDERIDRGDLIADAVGAGLAALLVAALTR